MTYQLFLNKTIIKKYLAHPKLVFVIHRNAWRSEIPGSNICENIGGLSRKYPSMYYEKDIY